MVAVRVADFGCGGAAPPPGGGGAAPCTARAAGNFGGLTGLEASFMRKPASRFCNPIPQTELIIAYHFVFGGSEFLRRRDAQTAHISRALDHAKRVLAPPHLQVSIRRGRPTWACLVRSVHADRRDLHTILAVAARSVSTL